MATTDASAQNLPDGTVVALDDKVYVKNNPTATAQWRSTMGGYHGDWDVDEKLASGAEVLRLGYGT